MMMPTMLKMDDLEFKPTELLNHNTAQWTQGIVLYNTISQNSKDLSLTALCKSLGDIIVFRFISHL